MKSLLILKSHMYLTRLQELWHKIKENDIKNAGKGTGDTRLLPDRKAEQGSIAKAF